MKIQLASMQLLMLAIHSFSYMMKIIALQFRVSRGHGDSADTHQRGINAPCSRALALSDVRVQRVRVRLLGSIKVGKQRRRRRLVSSCNEERGGPSPACRKHLESSHQLLLPRKSKDAGDRLFPLPVDNNNG
jgi:hypothetical protein